MSCSPFTLDKWNSMPSDFIVDVIIGWSIPNRPLLLESCTKFRNVECCMFVLTCSKFITQLLVFMLGEQSPRQSLLQVFMGGARLWGHVLHVYSRDEGRWEGLDWWHQLVWNVMEIASTDVIYISLLERWVCAIIDDLLCVLPDQPHAVGKGVEMIWSESLAL